MQDFGDYCDYMTVGSELTLRDVRDSDTYTVAKLEDQNCWMTQNLRTAGITLNSSTSDVLSTYTLPASNTTLLNSMNTNYREVYVDPTIGGYYSASAAKGQDWSICPKGWKMPELSDFTNLINVYNNNASALIQAPANFGFTGYIDYTPICASDKRTVLYPGVMRNKSDQGQYWSKYGKESYLLQVTDTGLTTHMYSSCNDYHYLASVRCVTKSSNSVNSIMLEDNSQTPMPIACETYSICGPCGC